MIGTPRQVAYATLIRNRIWQARPTRETLHALERRSDSEFWISRRAADYEQIISDAFDTHIISSPFTASYPRYTREDAQETLAQLADTQYVVLDCETTGISPKKADIIELAIVDALGETLFESLLMPHDSITIEERASGVNGITSEMLEDAPTLADTWPELREILTSAHLVTYNASFDVPFIRASARRWRLSVPALTATCLMKLSTAYFGCDTWLSLAEVAEMLLN